MHEYTSLEGGYRAISTDAVRVHFAPTTTTPSKTHWQAGLLEEDLLRDPDNPRTIFYLAQTYRQLGDPRGRDLYARRATMAGHEEERWFASLQAARMAPWPEMATDLMAVWEARPGRMEPLYTLVTELNRRDMHRAAYRLASTKRGTAPDELFTERGVWAWGMDFQLSIAAWWIGEHSQFRILSNTLLKMKDLPIEIREAIRRNLEAT
jgi:hypothetical protein